MEEAEAVLVNFGGGLNNVQMGGKSWVILGQ